MTRSTPRWEEELLTRARWHASTALGEIDEVIELGARGAAGGDAQPLVWQPTLPTPPSPGWEAPAVGAWLGSSGVNPLLSESTQSEQPLEAACAALRTAETATFVVTPRATPSSPGGNHWLCAAVHTPEDPLGHWACFQWLWCPL